MAHLLLELPMGRAALMLLGLVASLPFCLAAQAPVSLDPGQRVRLQTGSRSPWVIGTLVAVDTDSLHLLLSDTTRQLSIKRGAITRLEISHGMTTDAGSGARTGLLIGAAVGAFAGFSSGDDQSGFIRFSAGDKALMLGLAGAGFGALVGALAGSSPHERWDRVPLGPARVTVLPHRGGLIVAFRI
jgi:hypothetical protein